MLPGNVENLTLTATCFSPPSSLHLINLVSYQFHKLIIHVSYLQWNTLTSWTSCPTFPTTSWEIAQGAHEHLYVVELHGCVHVSICTDIFHLHKTGTDVHTKFRTWRWRITGAISSCNCWPWWVVIGQANHYPQRSMAFNLSLKQGRHSRESWVYKITRISKTVLTGNNTFEPSVINQKKITQKLEYTWSCWGPDHKCQICLRKNMSDNNPSSFDAKLLWNLSSMMAKLDQANNISDKNFWPFAKPIMICHFFSIGDASSKPFRKPGMQILTTHCKTMFLVSYANSALTWLMWSTKETTHLHYPKVASLEENLHSDRALVLDHAGWSSFDLILGRCNRHLRVCIVSSTISHRRLPVKGLGLVSWSNAFVSGRLVAPGVRLALAPSRGRRRGNKLRRVDCHHVTPQWKCRSLRE